MTNRKNVGNIPTEISTDNIEYVSDIESDDEKLDKSIDSNSSQEVAKRKINDLYKRTLGTPQKRARIDAERVNKDSDQPSDISESSSTESVSESTKNSSESSRCSDKSESSFTDSVSKSAKNSSESSRYR